MTKTLMAAFLLAGAVSSCVSRQSSERSRDQNSGTSTDTVFHIVQDDEAGTISVFRGNEQTAVLTQNAQEYVRPYIHPIVAPDGKGESTEYSPGHHQHQTGLYWGFTRLNGRDYFHNPGKGYWRRVAARVITAEGTEVSWQTVYDLLDENGQTVMTETKTWNMQVENGSFVLDLEWKGKAKTTATIGKKANRRY